MAANKQLASKSVGLRSNPISAVRPTRPRTGRMINSDTYEVRAAHANLMDAIKRANAEGGYRNASSATRENYLRAGTRSSNIRKKISGTKIKF